MMRAFGLAMILLGAAGLGLSMIDWPSNDVVRAKSETAPDVSETPEDTAENTNETTDENTDAGRATTQAALDNVLKDVQSQGTEASGDVAELSPANVRVFEPQAEEQTPAPVLWAEISAASEVVSEGSGYADFLVTLSEPAERSVVIIFSTINLSANDREDYQSQRGTVTFEPGVVSAEIRTPLVDDDIKEDDEQFAMILNGAPGIVTFKNRRVTTTIQDDD